MLRIFNRPVRTLLVGCLALGLPGGAMALADDDKAPAQTPVSDLPEAKQVLENALTAIGGREALRKIKSSHVKGEMATPMGSMVMESWYASPDRFLLKQVVLGMGEISLGSNGEVAWLSNPRSGFELLEEDQADQLKLQASMHEMVLRFEDEFESMETVGQMEFNGQECYKLRMVDEKDEGERFAFFSVADHLLIGIETTQDTFGGQSKMTLRFEDWKQYNAIKMFTTMVVTQMGMDMTMSLNEITFDAVDETVFDLPEQVREMAERRNAERDAETGDDTGDEEESA